MTQKEGEREKRESEGGRGEERRWKIKRSKYKIS